ncbi:MAG: uroporphyrinogen-III synthase, partial [Gammaproteobacteria bacterium]
MSSNLLKGMVVLNTRPAHQQQPLNDAIAASGGETVSLPLLRIDPLDDPLHRQQIQDLIMQLPRCDSLIFVSANAVTFAAPLIKAALGELPYSVMLFAIGQSTATALQLHFQ